MPWFVSREVKREEILTKIVKIVYGYNPLMVNEEKETVYVSSWMALGVVSE